MQSITYTLRTSDIVDFNEYHARRNGVYGKGITRHQMIWPGVVALVALFVVMSTKQAQMGVYFLVGAFVWSLVVPAWMKKRFQEQVLEGLSEEVVNETAGLYTLITQPKGIKEITPSGETLITWREIRRLEKTKRHLFLYISDDAALIIPKDTMTDESNLKDFNNDVVDYIQKTRK